VVADPVDQCVDHCHASAVTVCKADQEVLADRCAGLVVLADRCADRVVRVDVQVKVDLWVAGLILYSRLLVDRCVGR